MICIENVKRYCSNYEQIENYQEAASSPEKWDCHHRNEIDMNLSLTELKEMGLYYNRPASELIFLTRGDHIGLHKKGNKNFLGKIHSIKTRKKMSDALKGENHPLYGKHHSVDTRKKMSNAHTGKHHSKETRKKMSDALKGENHPLYGKHHSVDTRKKMSNARKGKIIKFICPALLQMLYIEQGKPAYKIAQELGISINTIRSRLKELNIKKEKL